MTIQAVKVEIISIQPAETKGHMRAVGKVNGVELAVVYRHNGPSEVQARKALRTRARNNPRLMRGEEI